MNSKTNAGRILFFIIFSGFFFFILFRPDPSPALETVRLQLNQKKNGRRKI